MIYLGMIVLSALFLLGVEWLFRLGRRGRKILAVIWLVWTLVDAILSARQNPDNEFLAFVFSFLDSCAPLVLWQWISSSIRKSIERRKVGSAKSVPYPDAGVAFTYKLISSLDLGGWNQGIPLFTQVESQAIQARLDGLQQMANAEGGGEVVFHPDAVERIQRQFGAEALKALADDEWKFSDSLPSTWKEVVSTYLKAWAMNLDPMVLVEVSELLSSTSYKSEAREAAEIVINSFPDYAPRFFAGADAGNEITNRVVASARQAIQRL